MTTETAPSHITPCISQSSQQHAPEVQTPLPWRDAIPGVFRCIGRSALLLARHQLRLPGENVDRWLTFANGTTARVYRETVVNNYEPKEPTVLVVGFRLRFVRGWGHKAFRIESILNTPLFVGFPGFVNKLWMANDANGVYRGVYQWDGEQRAELYARSLWRILQLGCVSGSICYKVVPGLVRDDVLNAPELLKSVVPEESSAWWRLVSVQ